MLLRVGAPIFAGVFFLFVARVLWVQGQRHRSLPWRWLSLGQVAFALCRPSPTYRNATPTKQPRNESSGWSNRDSLVDRSLHRTAPNR